MRSLLGAMLALLFGLPALGVPCELPPQPQGKPRPTVLRLIPSKSQVRFDAKAFLHSFAGTTDKIDGTIRLSDLDHLSDAEACVQIDAASLTTGNAVRDRNMREDHLETTRYPAITFQLLGVKNVRRDAQGWEFTASGTLGLHGVTRHILFPVRARREGEAVRFTGTLPLKMSEYGIARPRFLLLTVEDQVTVSFDVLAQSLGE